MNDNYSLQNLINNTHVNRFGGYLTPGRSYPPEKIADFFDKHHQFQCSNDREPTLNEFVEVSKIGGSDFALKVVHCCNHNVKLIIVKQEHHHVGPLSRIECLMNGLACI